MGKIDKPLAKLVRKKVGKTQMTSIKSKSKCITRDHKDTEGE